MSVLPVLHAIVDRLPLFVKAVHYRLFEALSYTFTLTLDFYAIVTIFSLLLSGLYYLFRYRFMMKYSRLPDPPKPEITHESFDFFPDLSDDQDKSPAFQDDSLNAFLSSIKIFGYLDKPVFHELASHLQTKKVKEGEYVLGGPGMDPTRDYIVVVDGAVQLFVKDKFFGSSDAAIDVGLEDDYDPNALPGYRLLQEVTAGGLVSSLFGVLSVLTDDLELPQYSALCAQHSSEAIIPEIPIVPDIDSDSPETDSPTIDPNIASDDSKQTNVPQEKSSSNESRLYVNTDSGSRGSNENTSKPFKDIHPDIVARTSTEATLAIIPAKTFRKLVERYPAAAAHFAQVILSRFQRVTFSVLHRLFGLSRELLIIERRVNEFGGIGLPKEVFDPQFMEQIKKFSFQEYSSDEGGKWSSQTIIDPRQHELEDQLRHCCFEYMMDLIGMNTEIPYSSSSSKGDIPTGTTTASASPFRVNLKRSWEMLYGYNSGSARRESLLSAEDAAAESSGSTTRLSVQGVKEWWRYVQIMRYARDETVLSEGDYVDGIFFVVDGILEASMQPKAGNRPKILFAVGPGGLAGYLACLTGHPSFVTISAKTNVQLAFLPKSALDKLCDQHPAILLLLGKRLIMHLSPLVLHLDLALEWSPVTSGQVLSRQGDLVDGIYFVLNGRLRAIQEASPSQFTRRVSRRDEDTAFGSPVMGRTQTYYRDPPELKLPSSALGDSTEAAKKDSGNKMKILEEYGKDEVIGDIHLFSGTTRHCTIYAIRDSNVAVMSKTLLEALTYLDPSITLQVAKMMARTTEQRSDKCENLKTIAILPVQTGIQVLHFADRIKESLQAMGASVGLLDNSFVLSMLGKHAFTRMGRLKLMNWLVEQEEIYRVVLYVADGGINSPWTKRCIRQADCILLVTPADNSPSVGDHEKLVLSMKTSAKKELVLVHSTKRVVPGSTVEWLKYRSSWISRFYHVLTETRESNKYKPNKLMTIKKQFERIYRRRPPVKSESVGSTSVKSDYARIARRILSRTVGLCLSGGGARGFAHVGVIRALEEAGVPVDIVGGTSMGAFVGGLYARENDHVSIFGRSKMFGMRAASIWRQLIDITYPAVALFTGHEFNRGLWKVFSNSHIEDCWLPFFCVTTNITHSKIAVHRTGYMWKYIRASMTLAGYLPPISDNGELLVDGGYCNNMPADLLKEYGADIVISVNVGGEFSTEYFSLPNQRPVKLGDTVSGWLMLLQRFNPFSSWIGPNIRQIPQLADIQGRLAYVSSVWQLEDAKRISGKYYLQPPVDNVGIMEFGRYHEIYKTGYEYAKDLVAQWQEQGLIDQISQLKTDFREYSNMRRASI